MAHRGRRKPEPAVNLTELRYIVALARERHFGRAAEACFVTQPTLSVGVRKLEEELGVRLFERRPGEVAPTAVGERVVARAQRILEEVERLRAEAEAGRDPLAGPLRVGAIFTIGPYLMPRLIPALRRRAPRMPLLLEEGYTATLAERLREGALDAIVISEPFSQPGVATATLYEEPFVVAVPAGHRWARRRSVRAAELAGEELLLLGPGHCFRDQVLALCPDCGRTAEPGSLARSLEGASLETIRHMVASGAGVTVLPCGAAEFPAGERHLVAVRPFARPAPARRVALAWRESFPRPEAVAALAAAARAAAPACARPVAGGTAAP